jgi:hypothetical protein
MPRRKPEGVGASVEASVILRNGLEPRDPEKNKHCILKCSVAWCTWTCQSETPKTFINGRTNPTYVHQLRFVWWCLKHLTWGRDSCASWVSCLGVASDTETATFVIHDMVRSSHRLVFSHHFCLSCLYLFMMWYDVFPTGDEKKHSKVTHKLARRREPFRPETEYQCVKMHELYGYARDLYGFVIFPWSISTWMVFFRMFSQKFWLLTSSNTQWIHLTTWMCRT